MKNLGDWHTHNYRCNHASGNLEDYIFNASKKNLGIIGLSDHFPAHYSKLDNTLRLKQFAMKNKEVEDYIREAIKLKQKYRNMIKVKIGFEIGYLYGKEDKYIHRLRELNGKIDYIIGSVHTIRLNNKYWGIKNDDLKYLINKFGANFIYSKYFKIIAAMLLSENFNLDIIGHLDYIKNGNENSRLNELILKKIEEITPYIKEKGVAVEINTQGLRNGYKKLYPCKKVLKLLYDNAIPIVLSSDAHDPLDVGYGFEKVINLIKKIGFRSIANLRKRKLDYTYLN
ncbi:MAG: histidinol-phosphatase [Promethearchaeati archaeon]